MVKRRDARKENLNCEGRSGTGKTRILPVIHLAAIGAGFPAGFIKAVTRPELLQA